MEVYREGTVIYMGKSVRPGQENRVSVKFYEIYDVQFSPEAQSKIEKVVVASKGQLLLLDRAEIVQGRLSKIVGGQHLEIGIAFGNVPAILEGFDHLPEGD